MDRRNFIKMLGLAGSSAAAYSACSAYMSEALANSTLVTDLLTADPHCAKGSLADIEHVVILMQENRSFDHYFGTLRGVRGFGDPRPMKLKNGEPIWHQPQLESFFDPSTPTIKPYRLPKGANADTDAGDVFLQDPPHGFSDGLAAWNNGLSDKWIPQKKIVSMAHYVEPDIPLYFQLAKAFTICDAYHCSVNGPTDPNRSYFFTGTSYSRTSNGDFSGLNVADDSSSRPNWKTYPERLEELEVEWKFYQDGLTWTDDAFSGNYGDNTLEYFRQYRGTNKPLSERSVINVKNQTINSVLRTEEGKPSRFEQDIIDDKLPAVSWIVPPEAFTEHPKYPPHFGEFYLSEILRALLANKAVWHKTVLLITYDENGGFFDHVLPPVPPMTSSIGVVSPGIKLSVSGRGGDFDSEASAGKPIGLGIRVPMLVISPWSSGGRVCSETFDHTSVIQFLEAWHQARGIDAPTTFGNIWSWRQAITGDLTSAFDFDRTKVKPMDKLVDAIQPTKIYSPGERQVAKSAGAYIPGIKDVNADPDAARPVSVKQDQTSCDLLPVGYDFQTLCGFTADSPPKLKITFRNRGQLGASFTILSYDRNDGGWFDSVEGVKQGSAPIDIFDVWNMNMNKVSGWSSQQYSYAVHGPNGYLAEFRGELQSVGDNQIAHLADVKPSADGKTIEFIFGNWPSANGKLKAVSAYTGEERTIDSGAKAVSFETKDGWYDISFVDAINSSKYLRRYAGHAENGKISRTDPAIGMKYDDTKRVYVSVVA
ncbi:phospholipase C, phosphocholine-specific [Phyllobacterium sp. SB3]|uniref:phosphocholine-specific phospholipase C n=1 Tax=Phyllobacterium sp. SB3 TaxID=3156073 RepID=UPI0032AEAF48